MNTVKHVITVWFLGVAESPTQSDGPKSRVYLPKCF